jgi:hypothetical protein
VQLQVGTKSTESFEFSTRLLHRESWEFLKSDHSIRLRFFTPGSARDRIQVQEAKHARRRAKEDRRKASRARGAAAVTPVLAAAVALATAEAVPCQWMPGESGPAYRRPSRGEEPDWPGQPEGARASAREPLGTLWW